MSPLTGTCLCAVCRYELRGKPMYAGYCHCSQCRKLSGSTFNALVAVRASHMAWLSGPSEGKLSSYWKSTATRMRFCRDCGSNLLVEKLLFNTVHVRMGTLDGEPPVRPAGHAFVGSKASWFAITDGLPQFEAMPTAQESAGSLGEALKGLRDEFASEGIGSCVGVDRSALVEVPRETFERVPGAKQLEACRATEGSVENTDFYEEEALVGSHVRPEGRSTFYVLARHLN